MAFVVFNKQGYEAVMFYLVVYMLMNFGAFWIIHIMAEKLNSEEISAYHGLGYRAPYSAVAMAIFMFSLTGLPPLAGFIGKLYLFAAVINQNWYWLAMTGVLNSVVSLYYYAGVVRAMFLKVDQPGDPITIPIYDKVLITSRDKAPIYDKKLIILRNKPLELSLLDILRWRYLLDKEKK